LFVLRLKAMAQL